MTTQARASLPQNIVILVETLRANGISDDMIIDRLRQGDISAFEAIGEGRLKWEDLNDFASGQRERFESAVKDGYRLTYLTVGGLRSILRIRYGKHPEQHYESVSNGVKGLTLPQEGAAFLQAVVPPFWSFDIAPGASEGESTLSITMPTAE